MTWENQQEIIAKIERRFLPELVKHIRRIFREGLERYRKGESIDDKFFDEQLSKLIIRMYEVSGVNMARYVYKTMPKPRELKQMGISKRWLNAVRNYLGRFALQFVTDIMGTLRDDMIKIFQKATAEGWGYDRIAKELLSNGIPLRRARVIARTEAHRGAMAGSLQGADSLGYQVQKQWLSATDVRVRRNPKSVFDHSELNGQIRELHEPFRNEEEIMQPGDPKASKGNTIQCRCVLNYIPKRDARGMLILK